MRVSGLLAAVLFLNSIVCESGGARVYPVSKAQRLARLHHARELLGKHYAHSSVREGENVKQINSAIYRHTRERLPKTYRREYKRVAQAIIDEAFKRNFDPVFLMSVIEQESRFIPTRKGALDEIGLMQLRPATAEWIAEKYGMKWKGPRSLYDPVVNIRIGAAYLSYLREKFDSHAQLYLAAYNMGARSVASAREKNVWPKDYPVGVMRHYVDFYQSL